MAQFHRFRAKLKRPGDGGSAIFFEVPPAIVTALGSRKRVPVVVGVNGHQFRTTIAVYGGKSLVGFNAAARAGTGAKAGDTVTATLQVDDAPRTIEVPKELAAALRAAGLLAWFNTLSYSNRREHTRYVEDAKRLETREARAKKTVEALRAKR